MTMPASLLGFGFFRMVSRHLAFPFSPVENVLVQSVAGGCMQLREFLLPLRDNSGDQGRVSCSGICALPPVPYQAKTDPRCCSGNNAPGVRIRRSCWWPTMPSSLGFLPLTRSQLPAMNYLLTPDEQGPLNLSLWQLIVWSLGLCYFGVVFAVPLASLPVVPVRPAVTLPRPVLPLAAAPIGEEFRRGRVLTAAAPPSHYSGETEVSQRLQHRRLDRRAPRAAEEGRAGLGARRLRQPRPDPHLGR